MTTKHTPGPWLIARDDLDSGEIAWHVYAEQGNVCRMYRRDADDIRAGAGSAKADANLIAASPDLLAACEALAPLVEGLSTDSGFGGYLLTGEQTEKSAQMFTEAVQSFRAAVAKAKGEKP